MLSNHKWKIASLIVITLPLCIFLIDESTSDTLSTILIVIGMSPILVAVSIELIAGFIESWRTYQKTGDFPPGDSGSPVGNKIAVVLAILFVLIFIIPIGWAIIKELT